MRFRKRGRSIALAAVLLLACDRSMPAAVALAKEPARSPGRRHALLIGIDDYSRQAAESTRGLNSLRGAVRDAEWVQEMLLSKYEFQRHEIMVLKNREATNANIIKAIKAHLIDPVRKDDVVLFYYSGHGSQVLNSLSPELDKHDETIVPADAADITDKQLSGLFNQVLDRGAHLTLIFDSCHSASILREVRGLPPDSPVRGVAPNEQDVREAAMPVPPESRGALVLSASSDFGRAFERQDEKGQYHGVFSFALLRAMQAGPRGESASDTFLRAQAMMRAETPFQNPVMGGNALARLIPLFAADPNDVPETPPIAVEEITPEGIVKMQGGWAQGLTEGTLLRLRDEASDLRVRVDTIVNFGRSEGHLVATRGEVKMPSPPSGALLEIAAWAPPPSRSMRVWIPQTDDIERARAFGVAVKEAAARSAVQWVDDPTQKTPTHVLRWRSGAWEICTATAEPKRLAAGAGANAAISQIPPHSTLFVQLPVAAALAQAINVGRDRDHDSVEQTDGPESADYILAGRLVENTLEYAWVRPATGADDAGLTPLPVRSDWHSPLPLREASIILQQSIFRLYKILAWYFIPSPPDTPSPYRLTLLPRDGGAIERNRMVGLRKYMLTLQASQDPMPSIVQPRYYYIFGIDSFGASKLLYPVLGSVENRFPAAQDGTNPLREIPVRSITVKPPYGIDTYFLISTDEPIPNPLVLQWSGVRTRGPKGETSLEDLLSRTGGSSRSMEGDAVPAKWSIDHLVFESIPPQ